MEELTVRELIEALSKLDQDAIACHMDLNNIGKPFFFPFHVVKEYPNVTYEDSFGYEKKGKVVAIF